MDVVGASDDAADAGPLAGFEEVDGDGGGGEGGALHPSGWHVYLPVDGVRDGLRISLKINSSTYSREEQGRFRDGRVPPTVILRQLDGQNAPHHQRLRPLVTRQVLGRLAHQAAENQHLVVLVDRERLAAEHAHRLGLAGDPHGRAVELLLNADEGDRAGQEDAAAGIRAGQQGRGGLGDLVGSGCRGSGPPQQLMDRPLLLRGQGPAGGRFTSVSTSATRRSFS